MWAKNKKRLRKNEDLKEEFNQAQNRYYQTIKKAKQEYQQNFLQSKTQFLNIAIDKNHCWKALKYIKLLKF